MDRSEQLFREAVQFIPGGVNSPVRAFGALGSVPRFIREAHGALLVDEDGKEYIDFIGSWGPMILGHGEANVIAAVQQAVLSGLSFGAVTRMEVELAKLICRLVPSVELVRMVNSGTEAVMSAIRVARGFTGRDKVVKFDGCYHGHADGLLVMAGSGVLSLSEPSSAGVPKGCTNDTLTAVYNDLEQVSEHFRREGEQIAAVIVEPVAANMGVVPPADGFLQGLQRLCQAYGALLIFDEVITGFRLGLGGAQEYFGIRPDLTVFGKIIGGGMPVGAYGGKREIMEVVAPLGQVYQAGTLSGNPVAMAAGFAQLSVLQGNLHFYNELEDKSEYFFGEVAQRIADRGWPCRLNYIGSLGCLFFTGEPVVDFNSALTCDVKAYSTYCNFMMESGVYLAPAQFEAMFLSAAHTKEQLERTLAVMDEYFEKRI
jgi:glutamate-1-semialdehyde 2,1-aminomutase